MDTKDLITKGVKALKEIFSKEELVHLNEIAAPVVAPVVAAPVALEAKEMKTKDGVSVYVMTDESGVMKVFSDAAGTLPQADGELVMEDGSTLVIVGGVATKKEVENPMPDPMAEMKTELSKQEESFKVQLANQNKELKAEIASLVEANKTLAVFMQKVIDTGIYTEAKIDKKEYKDMTPAEKYNHDNPITKK